MLSEIWYRLRALVRRDAVEQERDAELRFHLEQQTAKYVQAGLSAKEAARCARLMFGGIDSVKEHCRDARGLARLETLWQDIRLTAGHDGHVRSRRLRRGHFARPWGLPLRIILSRTKAARIDPAITLRRD